MNIYSLLPLIAFFANIILGCFLLYRDSKDKLNRLFSLFTFALAIWAITDFLTFTALTPEIGLYWDKIGMIGSSFTPVFLLQYFLVFSKNKFISKKGFFILLYLPAIFFIFAGLTTNLISKQGETVYWGQNTHPGVLFFPFTIYVAGYILIGLFSCYKFYKLTTKTTEKKQTMLLIVATSIPLIGGIITEAIPDLFGFKILPLSTTLTTIASLIIAYAIFKYKLMTPVRFRDRKSVV